MRVSSFWAKFRNLVLTIFAIVTVTGGVVADFIFRHETTGKARRQLENSGFQLSAAGIIQAIQQNQLSLFEVFDTAKIGFSGTNEIGMTPLNFAIAEKNQKAIGALMQRKRDIKPSIDIPGKDGITPLNRALQHRDFTLADQLISLGANINREKTPGLPWLIDAINQDDSEMRTYLLNNKIDVNERGSQPLPPVAIAARDDDLEMLQQFASRGADLSITGSTGNTLLLEAILDTDTPEVDFLLEQKVSPNERGTYPHPPLAVAANSNDVGLMKKLIKHGADINIKGMSGKPLFTESILEDSYKEIDLLLESGADPEAEIDGQTPLLLALERQDGYLRNLLIKHGAKLDRNGASGRHLAYEALDNGDHDWLMQLIESGISADLKSKDGNTLLLTAMADNNYKLVDFLIEKDADVNKPNSRGITPITHAVSNGDMVMARALIVRRADIEWEHVAETAYNRRDNPMLSLLLNAGMSSEIKLPTKNKRLFDVAMNDGAINTARILLTAGANLGDNFWKALENDMDEVAILCLQEGADAVAAGPDGRAPLRYVMDEEKYSMILPLLKAGAHQAPGINTHESWLARLIRNGDAEIALGLLKSLNGASLGDARAGDGHSLMAWSIANEMDEVSLALIKAGVDVNAIEPAPASKDITAKFDESSRFRTYLRVDSKMRPLMMAAVKRQHVVARAMINSGARNVPSRKYNYPVSIAAWFSDNRMMQILFNRNPDYQPRKLVVDLSSQRVQLYENGKITHSSICSTGKSGYRTATGSYVITQKNKDHESNLYDAKMPYFMRLSCRDFGFHTGHCPGYAASHGCIRLPNETAKKFFYTCSLGDLVVIKQ